MDPTHTDRTPASIITASKVPLVTLYFWIIKILATTVGETGADYLNFNMHLGLGKTSWIMAGRSSSRC